MAVRMFTERSASGVAEGLPIKMLDWLRMPSHIVWAECVAGP
jgi:hypothetical protein